MARMKQSLLLAASLPLHRLITVSGASCMYPDGYVAHQWQYEPNPSDKGTYASCCIPSEGDVFLSDGLCYYPPITQADGGRGNTVFRGGCTDPTFQDDACASHCTQNRPDMYESVLFCAALNATAASMCCQLSVNSGSCCDAPVDDDLRFVVSASAWIIQNLNRTSTNSSASTSTSSGGTEIASRTTSASNTAIATASNSESSGAATDGSSSNTAGSQTPNASPHGISTGVVAGIAIGSAAAVAIIILAVILCLRRRKQRIQSLEGTSIRGSSTISSGRSGLEVADVAPKLPSPVLTHHTTHSTTLPRGPEMQAQPFDRASPGEMRSISIGSSEGQWYEQRPGPRFQGPYPYSASTDGCTATEGQYGRRASEMRADRSLLEAGDG